MNLFKMTLIDIFYKTLIQHDLYLIEIIILLRNFQSTILDIWKYNNYKTIYALNIFEILEKFEAYQNYAFELNLNLISSTR